MICSDIFLNLLLRYFGHRVLTNIRKNIQKKLKTKERKEKKKKKRDLILSKCLESLAIAQGSAQRRFEKERNTG